MQTFATSMLSTKQPEDLDSIGEVTLLRTDQTDETNSECPPLSHILFEKETAEHLLL